MQPKVNQWKELSEEILQSVLEYFSQIKRAANNKDVWFGAMKVARSCVAKAKAAGRPVPTESRLAMGFVWATNHRQILTRSRYTVRLLFIDDHAPRQIFETVLSPTFGYLIADKLVNAN